MSEKALINQIKGMKTFCICCQNLKEDVENFGLEALDHYDGMICGGVEQMLMLRHHEPTETKGSSGGKWRPR